MPQQQPKLRKDRNEIIQKFEELIKKADEFCDIHRSITQSGGGHLPADKYMELKVSSINLLERLATSGSIYVRELLELPSAKGSVDANVIKGILEAARADYLQGFMADHKLLLSAEVFTDLLVQAEILLDSDYKDAAAVIIRAVLEDGLRKLCDRHDVDADPRETIQQLNEKLYKQNVYSKLMHKEVIAKAEIGNCAAHARFDEYSKQDVNAFREFVLRFLAQHLN